MRHFGNLFWSCALDVRAVKFSHLLSPEWSIQISGAPAVSKAETVHTHGRFFSSFFPFLHFVAKEGVNPIIYSHWFADSFADTVISCLQLARHLRYHENNQNKIIATVNSRVPAASFQLELRITRMGHI